MIFLIDDLVECDYKASCVSQTWTPLMTILTPKSLRRSLSFLFLAIILTGNPRAQAQTYTYTNTTSGSDTWNTTTSAWSSATLPVSSASSSLSFDSGKTFTGGSAVTINSANNVTAGTVAVGGNANAFLLNNLTLAGTTAASTPTTINISGNALDFVNNSSTAPTITLSGASANTSTSLLTYIVSNNLVFGSNVTVNGAGSTGYYNFDGTFSGSGNLTVNTTNAVVSINAAASYLGANNGYRYAGNVQVQSGELIGGSVNSAGAITGGSGAPTNNDFYSLGGLNVSSGATFDLGASNFAFSSLTGSGLLLNTGGGSQLAINYVGPNTDTFTGTYGVTNSTIVSFRVNGDGILSVPALTASSTILTGGNLFMNGSGVISLGAVADGIVMFNSNGIVELTNHAGNVQGTRVEVFLGGTEWIKPTFTSADNQQTVQGTGGISYQAGNDTVVLDANGNGGITLSEGSSSATTPVLNRGTGSSSSASLTIVPTAGLNALGSTDIFNVIGGSGALPVNTNNLAGQGLNGGTGGSVGPSIFAASPGGNGTADFVTYIGNGSATSGGVGNDIGFVAASNPQNPNDVSGGGTPDDGVYTAINSFTDLYGSNASHATNNTSVVDLNAGISGWSPVTVSGAASAYALRITSAADAGATGASPSSSADLTLNSTLTLGDGVSHDVAGLILNGGVIKGSGTIAVGGNEFLVYTDLANGVIGTAITTTDKILTKTGPGTLFLTNTLTSGTTIYIDQGAVDVGSVGSSSTTSTILGSTSTNIVLDGGVLQGNGTYGKSLSGIVPSFSSGGGFAAYNGTLNVTGGVANGASLTWGASTLTVTGLTNSTFVYSNASGFLNNNSTTTGINGGQAADTGYSKELIFGSNVSNSQVNFESNIALGLTTDNYYRDIVVNLGTGTDSALLSGVLSDSPNSSSTFSGVTYTAQGAGAHGILKDGPGTLITSNNNTYTGLTQVSNGSLFVNGSNTGQGSYTISPLASTSALTNNGVTGTDSLSTPAQYNYFKTSTSAQTTANGALLAGTGTIGLAASQSVTLTGVSPTELAHIEPGISTSVGAPVATGSLTIGTSANTGGNINAVNFGSYSSLDINLSGTTSTELVVLGNVNITDSTTAVLSLNLLGAPTGSGLYDVLNYTGALTGTFDNGASTLIASFGSSNYTFNILYNSGQVDLQLAPPTPATAYFTGTASSDMTSASNYVSSPTGGAVGGAPGSTSDVYVTANSGTTGANALMPDTNTGALSIKGLFLTGTGTPATSTVTLSGSNTLTIGADGLTVQTGAGNDTVNAPVVLGPSQTWTVTDSGNTLTVSGGVGDGGAGKALTKAGLGKLVLSGASTYSGGTTISAGTLVAGVSNIGSTSGAFGPTDGTTGVVTLGDANTTTNNSSPTLLINGAFTVANPITVANQATTGKYTIGGSNTSGTATYTGKITLNKAVTLQAAPNGTVDFNSGTWVTNNNAFTIGSSGNTGTIELDNAVATSGGVTVANGTLLLGNTMDVTGGTLGVTTAGTLSSNSSGTVTGNVTLTGSGIINLNSASNISGTLGVTGGNWNGAGSVTGAVTSSSGNFNIGSSANLTANGGLSVSGGTISSTDGTGAITGSVSYGSGSASTFQGVIAGSGKTVSVSAGSLILTGSNTYTGGTTITSGTLLVENTSGSGTGTGGVTVGTGTANSGTLAGNGIIKPGSGATSGVTVNSGGTLYSGIPGTTSVGAGTGMTLDNTLAQLGTANNSSILSVNGDAPATLTFALGSGTTAGSGYHTFGTPNTNTTYMTVVGNTAGEINFSGIDAVNLVDLTNGGLTLRLGTPYLLISAGSDSDYVGLVTELNGVLGYGNGFVVGVGTDTLGGYTPITINQFGSDGTTPLNPNSPTGVYPVAQLYLYNGDLEVVPEPGTWALMLGGLAALILIQRRRNKQD